MRRERGKKRQSGAAQQQHEKTVKMRLLVHCFAKCGSAVPTSPHLTVVRVLCVPWKIIREPALGFSDPVSDVTVVFILLQIVYVAFILLQCLFFPYSG
jgi:hypothetical protein